MYPVVWPPASVFYPIGDSPPVNLRQHCSAANVDFLLLDCGDPRHILYTVYAGGNVQDRSKLDFTCCDWEPAVLARNVLLLTLVADKNFEENKQLVWNIFYHFLLDKKSLSLLTAQCKKLVAAASDLVTWRKSPFSSLIDLGSSFTLRELRHCWRLYASANGSFRSSQFRASFLVGMKLDEEGHPAVALGLSRSIEPLGPEVLGACMEAVCHYRNLGVTHRNAEDIRLAANINPTFAYSNQGEGFMANYRTSLLSAFHLVQAFIPNDMTPAPPYSSSLDHIFGVIRSQFFSWCRAFSRHVALSHSITVRVIVGDAFAFCNALSDVHPGGHSPRVAHWRGTIFDLDGSSNLAGTAPRSFDVIDTSNLSDYYGMLNVIVACTSLLKRRPTSVFHTETFFSPSVDNMAINSSTSLGESLRGDVTVMSILLDLAPIPSITGYTTHPNLSISPTSWHQRIAWKAPSQLGGLSASYNPSVAFGSSELARTLFDLYLQIFSRENHSVLMRGNRTLEALLPPCYIHYSRSSFAHFLFRVAQSVATDWQKVIDELVERIIRDRSLPIGSNYLQDLLLQLYLMGLYRESAFLPQRRVLEMNRVDVPFSGWGIAPPPTVYVAFTVPRARFSIIENSGILPEPVLAVQILSSPLCNNFQSIETMFGTLSVKGKGPNRTAVIHEQSKSTRSPVVVILPVPTWTLIYDPRNTIISLIVVSTPMTALLTPHLGLNLSLFDVHLMKARGIHVLNRRPTIAAQSSMSTPMAPVTRPTTGETVPELLALACVDRRRHSIVAFKQRVELAVDKTHAGSVLDKMVDKARQNSLNAVEFTVGHPERPLSVGFPFPVDGPKATITFDKNASSIYLTVPPLDPYGSFDARQHATQFSFISQAGEWVPWATHSVRLDTLPAISFEQTAMADLGWLITHLGSVMADREREKHVMSDAILRLKLTILFIASHAIASSWGSEEGKVIAIGRSSTREAHFLLFISKIRLDLPNSTVVVDAFLLPVSSAVCERVDHVLTPLIALAPTYYASDAELLAWEVLLPCLAERCRTWEHLPECLYNRPGGLGRSELVCQCGSGRDTAAFFQCGSWRPFAPYVTRIAINQLFPASYREPVPSRPGWLRKWRRYLVLSVIVVGAWYFFW